MSAERLHHPFSPSSLQAREACAYWENESKGDTEASLAGTRQHDAAENHVDIDDPALSDHEAEAVATCKRYRDQVVAKYPGGFLLKEVYLPVDARTLLDKAGNKFAGTTGGYVDFAVVSADEKSAEILDWKFGLWSVEPAENNLQGIAYLLGLFFIHPKLEQVTVHFCMPHREEIEVHTFTRDQFDALMLRVKTVVARAEEARRNGDTSKATPSTSACLFCAKKGTCQALAAVTLRVGKKYAPIKVPENLTPSLFSDPKEAKVAMELAQLMEAWAKAVRAQITTRSIEDEAWMPEGYKLRSRADNSVKDWRKVLNFARKAGVPAAAIRAALTVRMTPINKAVQDAAPRGSKTQAADDFRDVLLQEGALEKEQPIYFLERLKT